MDITIIRFEKEVIARYEDEEGIHKLGLGEIVDKTDAECIELAKKQIAVNLDRKNNPLPPSYQELRAKEYPPIQDQLDMMYWDAKNKTTIWIDIITAVKVKYPKS